MKQSKPANQTSTKFQHIQWHDFEKLLEEEKEVERKPKSVAVAVVQDNVSAASLRKNIRMKLHYHTSLKWQVSDELDLIKSQLKQEVKFKSPLQLYEQSNRRQDYVMKFETPDEINKDIFDVLIRKFGHPRTIHANEHMIAIGGGLGHLLIYWQNRPEKQLVLGDKGVICSLDVNPKGSLIAVGFENGTVGIIDVAKNEYVKVCKEVHAKCRVMIVRFVFTKRKDFSVFSSDEFGVTRFLHFEKSIFGYNYIIQLGLGRQLYPYTAVSVLSQAMHKRTFQDDPNVSRLVALASLSSVTIIRVFKDVDEPIQVVQQHANHLVTQNMLYSSLDWGFGAIPPPSLENQHHWTKPRLLLLCSIKNQVLIYVMKQDEPSYTKSLLMTLQPLVFPESSHIQFVNFFGESVFGVYTQDRNFYLINTYEVQLHIDAKTINAIPHLQYKDKFKIYGSALTNLYQVRQPTVPERSQTMHDLSQYQPNRSSGDQQLYPIQQSYSACLSLHTCYILFEKRLVEVKLIDWQAASEHLMQQGDWSSAMYLIKSVNDGTVRYSPKGKQERKEPIQKQTVVVTSAYINVILKQIKSVFDRFKSLETRGADDGQTKALNMVQSMISLLIDFLLNVNPDMMFGQVYTVFHGFLKGDIRLVANELKPYISNNRLVQVAMNTNVISDLLQYYSKANDPKIIQQFVQSLDLQKVDVEPLMQFCLAKRLIKPLTYLCTEAQDKNFIAPLMKLWGIYLEASENQRHEEAFNSGLNILNYLDSILEKYQLKLRDSSEILQILPPLAGWLFDENTILNLFMVDLTGTMEILILFFQPPLNTKATQTTSIKLWQKVLSKCLQDLLNRAEKPLVKLQQQQRATITNKNYCPWNVLVQQVQLVYEALFYITDVTEQLEPVKLSRLLQQPEALSFLPLSGFDFPHFHQSQVINEEVLRFCVLFGQNQFLVRLINKVSPTNLSELEEYAQLGQLYYVHILIMELQRKLIKTLNLKVHLYKVYSYIKMDEHLDLFQWVDGVLKSKFVERSEFKERVLHFLNVLVQINPSRTRHLIHAHFQDSDLTIIDKLAESPQLQLDYLEYILSDDKLQVDPKLLSLKVKLLCTLKPDQVLDYLTQQTIPLDDAIEICSAHNHIKALSYLFERQGASIKAVRALVQLLPTTDRVMELIDELIQLCLRLSRFDDGDEVWVTFVDALLAMPRSDFEIQLERVFSVWSQNSQGKFLDQIVAKYTHLKAVNLCSTFLGMYESQMFLENVFQSSKDIFLQHIVVDSVRLERVLKKGTLVWGFCYQCAKRLRPPNELHSIVQFFCGHTYHLHCLENAQFSIQRVKHDFYYKCPECQRDKKVLYLDVFRAAKEKLKQLKQPKQKRNTEHIIQKELESQVQHRKNDMAEKISRIQQPSPVFNQNVATERSQRLRQYDQLRTFKKNEQATFVSKLNL